MQGHELNPELVLPSVWSITCSRDPHTLKNMFKVKVFLQ